MREIHNNHNVCVLAAQLVLVVYRRQKLLNKEAVEVFKEAFTTVAKNYDIQLENVNGEPDHLHVLFSFNVTSDLAKFVSSLKSCSSRKMKAFVPNFRWSSGYWMGTYGGASEDLINDYVDQQGGVD